MNTYAYGHDFGNSETCAVMLGPGWMHERAIPSVAAPGSWKVVMQSAAGMGRSVKELLQHNHYVLEYDRELPDGSRQHVEKILGQKVFDDGATPMETRGDDARYWTNGYSLEALMVGSASMIADSDYRLHVVTGLPVSAYSQESAALVRTALAGTHLFWLNGVQRILYVESVKVIMEGAGALIAHGSSDANVLQGVIDSGGQTTDLFISRGQTKPLTSLCKGKPLGVGAAADRFNLLFKNEFSRDLNLAMRMELLRQHVTHRPYRSVQDRSGNVINARLLHTMMEQALNEIGQEIATFAAATWSDSLYDLDRVLLVGGGAYYFARAIQERFRLALPTSKPELANASGYALLAEKIAERSRIHLAS